VSSGKQYKSAKRWLNYVKPSTSKPYLHFLNRFCEYARNDPDTLVVNAKSDLQSGKAVARAVV